MPTIATVAVVVVYGFVFAGLLFVVVLARLASRYEQTMQVDLDARRLRLKVLITPTRCRNVGGPSAPDENNVPLRSSEKSS